MGGVPTVWQLTSLIRLRPPQSEWAKKDTRGEQHKQGEPRRWLRRTAGRIERNTGAPGAER